MGFADFPGNAWAGLMAPPKTPRTIVEKLNATVNDILQSPETKASLAKLNVLLLPGSPEEFSAYRRAADAAVERDGARSPAPRRSSRHAREPSTTGSIWAVPNSRQNAAPERFGNAAIARPAFAHIDQKDRRLVPASCRETRSRTLSNDRFWGFHSPWLIA